MISETTFSVHRLGLGAMLCALIGGEAFAQNLTPLESFYSYQREDYFSAATEIGIESGYAEGYDWIGTEGCVLTSAERGAVPLNLYYSEFGADNVLAATSQGNAAARNAGYLFIRREGFVLTRHARDTIPLYTYYNPYSGDNVATTSPRSLEPAYEFVRVEGYVYPSEFCSRR
jgi:hypothetical protein